MAATDPTSPSSAPSPTGTAAVLDDDALDALLTRLGADDRAVIGPVVEGGAVVVDRMSSLEDLARGRDDQAPGRYRFDADRDAPLFGPTTPARGWTRFLRPESTVVVRRRRVAGADVVEVPASEVPPLAFFGIRSCDLAALGVLDGVLGAGSHPDPDWSSARADTVVVATACTAPVATCFCASAGTGPGPGDGADLVLTELAGTAGEARRVVAEPRTDTGRHLLDRLRGAAPATASDLEEATRAVTAAAEAQTRRIDPDAARVIPAEHPHWNKVAERCLTCGNCTLVCPTCFCSSVTEQTDLSGDVAERRRDRASCFSLDFSEIHGGNIRTSPLSRYRQWLMHKLVTWHDHFGGSGCVGCGRCITWCPTGIDLTAEVPAFEETAP